MIWLSQSSKSIFLFLLCLCVSLSVMAQEDDDPLAPDPEKKSMIPMDTLIPVKLVSRDTATLEYYNLYAFEYSAGKQKITSEFWVPKKEDKYRNKALQIVNVKLCRITEFINSYQGIPSPPMEVEEFIEVTKPNGKDKQFYNFDVSMPNAVYRLCEIQEQRKDKN